MKPSLQHAIATLFPSLSLVHTPNPADLHFKGDNHELAIAVDDKAITGVVIGSSNGEILSQHQATDINRFLTSLTTDSALPEVPFEQLFLHNEEPRWITVPMLWHHGADGEPHAGYSGSGPADTALSILCHFIPVEGPHTDMELRRTLGYPEDPDREDAYLDSLDEQEREVVEERYWRGYQQLPIRLRGGVYAARRAFLLHQAFKRDFLEHARDGLNIWNKADIKEWIQNQPPESE